MVIDQLEVAGPVPVFMHFIQGQVDGLFRKSIGVSRIFLSDISRNRCITWIIKNEIT